MNKKSIFLNLTICLLLLLPANSVFAAQAPSCPLEITSENHTDCDMLTDNSYNTTLAVSADDRLTITSKDAFCSLYIEWAAPVKPWSLTVNGDLMNTCHFGKEGFLHEYVTFDLTHSVTLYFPEASAIANIRAFGEGEVPSAIQQWEPPCEKADILLLSTHADDEILFFGGILPVYAGERNLAVQVVYFSQYWNGQKIREHEKLDGLWTAGVRNYPVNLTYDDYYSETFEQALSIYGHAALSDIMAVISRFQPQIVVAQDFNGEYGHGTHQFTSRLTAEAVEVCASLSGPEKWDVPKTYIHLYPENSLHLDMRTPLDAFDGKTALTVAQEAYKKHVSQQWCRFYVSDSYEHSCADFGLYRTTVGPDTGNDLMEHLTSYEEQHIAELEAIKKEKKDNTMKCISFFSRLFSIFRLLTV